ncbi:hypothetical protein JMJ35_005224 [Cladonia borealis]|uniref:LITAF domain-containing protein n=1 Tax=Cladonia borealis TaxID=184061 RepID=A0AA39UA55_9LECA|nr:hypothetical protein JMJ35_005224 [Cladonia borealis]
MDDKTAVPPYETTQQYQAQPHPQVQHTTSFGSAPGQPQVQGDIYQSPMPTGQTTGTTFQQSPPMATAEKQEYYAAAQPVDPNMQQQQMPLHQNTMPMQQPIQQPIQQPMQQPIQQPIQTQSTYQTAIPLGNLQEAAAPVDCPVCRQRALTRTEYVAGNTTHAWGAVICLVFLLGCIPYLMTGLKDVNHKCGHCGVLLATWKRSGRTVVHQHM